MESTPRDRERAAKLTEAQQAQQRKLNERRDLFYAGYDAANEAVAQQFGISAIVPKNPSDHYKRVREDRFQLFEKARPS